MSTDSNDTKPELSQAKKALLEARMRLRASQEGIPRRNQTEAPLSFAQQRLWFLDQFLPGSCAYNVPRLFHLKGQLDVQALQTALDALVERHEILRTIYKMAQADPVQVVQPPRPVSVLVCDLPELPEAERKAKLDEMVMQEVKGPFNLSSDLMLRAKLIRVTRDEYVLVLMTHHIASDGWSKGLMFRDLAAFYNAAVSNTQAVLPPLPIQYSDFAIWQKQWVKGMRLQKQAAYWKKQLEGAPELLELPTDLPRPAQQGFDGIIQYDWVPAKLLADLKALSQREGVTLFMTLFASFQVMLARYSGQEDIVTGTPIAGRIRPEVEPLIGDFVNMLAFRTDLSGSPSFKELLQRVKKAALDAYENQELPFENLVEELEHGRDMSRAPIFQTIFILETTPPPPPTLKGVSLDALDCDTPTAKNDLVLALTEDTEGLKVKLEYRADLFSTTTGDRFLAQYRTLLQQIAAKPDRPIDSLDVLSDAERKQQIVGFNATEQDYPRDLCIHQFFERQVEKTPQAIAATSGKMSLSYAELDRRANQLARYLQKQGVLPQTLVGVCLDRSVDMLVAVLGVLKAGAAYVPLDPAYPKDRIAFVIEDSRACVLVTQSSLIETLPQTSARFVSMDSDWESIARESDTTPELRTIGESPAYVIYTSGSTGKPKGVEILHRSVVNFLASIQREPGFLPEDTLLAVTTLSFDIAGLELYLPLIAGGKVVIASREEAGNGDLLMRLLEQSKATVMQATPATWRLLIDSGWKGDSKLKVLCGGEALPRELAEKLLPRCRELWNMYGPTETTIWSSTYRVQDVNWTSAPIGKPIANTQMYVLDKNTRLVPLGVPGELHIGGDGVASGYWNRPELTSQKFIPDPFRAAPGARLYKTGDSVRYLADGNLQYLSRIDNQVKLRGFRIELGEIETVLMQFAGIRQAVADVKASLTGEKRLVAYLVPEDGTELSQGELRAFLKTKLPEYMVPATFMLLEKLPASPNGKLNRNALPLPDDARPQLAREFVPPSTPVEQAVADIFSEVLEARTVGLHDDFFELGGHSLLAARVVTRLRDRFQIEMTPRVVFESPTVKELASRVGELLVQGADEEEMAAMLAELAELEER